MKKILFCLFLTLLAVVSKAQAESQFENIEYTIREGYYHKLGNGETSEATYLSSDYEILQEKSYEATCYEKGSSSHATLFLLKFDSVPDGDLLKTTGKVNILALDGSNNSAQIALKKASWDFVNIISDSKMLMGISSNKSAKFGIVEPWYACNFQHTGYRTEFVNGPLVAEAYASSDGQTATAWASVSRGHYVQVGTGLTWKHCMGSDLLVRMDFFNKKYRCEISIENYDKQSYRQYGINQNSRKTRMGYPEQPLDSPTRIKNVKTGQLGAVITTKDTFELATLSRGPQSSMGPVGDYEIVRSNIDFNTFRERTMCWLIFNGAGSSPYRRKVPSGTKFRVSNDVPSHMKIFNSSVIYLNLTSNFLQGEELALGCYSKINNDDTGRVSMDGLTQALAAEPYLRLNIEKAP